jgi:hypothetical protein
MNTKTYLLEAIAGKNRGLLVNEKDKVKIFSIIEQLEDENPTPEPLQSKELLDGNWRLLYTSSKAILGLNNLPLLQLGKIYQYIRMEERKIYNIAEIVGLPFLEGLVSVSATFDVVSPKRINVNFQRSIFGLQRLLGYVSPSDFIYKIEEGNKFLPFDLNFEEGKKFLPFDLNLGDTRQKGWLEITYLDDNLRISRGNEGNVFVLTKNS